MKIAVPRRAEVAVRLVSGGEVHPGVGGTRIDGERSQIGMDSAGGIWLPGIVLPIIAQKIPVAVIARLQANGALVTLAGLEVGVMDGNCIANAEIGKKHRCSEGNDQNDSAR